MTVSSSTYPPFVSPDDTTLVRWRPEPRTWVGALVTACGLGLILLLAAMLRFYRLGADGVGNEYYAATVRSMLASPHNFFFAAFEPGGSVTVDKPPLGFWIQALSAAVLGLNGFALALPQALAGLLSVALLFYLVRRSFGRGAGLLAATALAVTPVAVAAERNNTIDGLLVFVLLLAAWAFVKAAERGRLRYLLAGAVLVGLGFNIKMLQAFLPLPAFYALYLFAGNTRLWRKVVNLTVATIVLLVVSLSWAVIVDLTPPEARPYIGSSANNTVMELIVGHNGLSRLLPGGLRALVADGPGTGRMGPPTNLRPPGAPPDTPAPPAGQFTPPPRPPAGGLQSGGGGSAFNWEIGEPGALRLFRQPLVDQSSWWIPLAAIGALAAVLAYRPRWPLDARHGDLLLWGGWLGIGAVFFSVASLFHAYYLIMLAPPLAALLGIGGAALWRLCRERPARGSGLLMVALVMTAGFQVWVLREYPPQAWWLVPLIILGTVASVSGLVLGLAVRNLAPARLSQTGRAAAMTVGLAAVMIAPWTWSVISASGAYANASLPGAGPPTAEEETDGGRRGGPPPGGSEARLQDLIAYLTPRTQEAEYLVATLSARDAAPVILATGRPVLTFGGFSGGDSILTADDLAHMVAMGELRYVYVSLQELARRHGELAQWMAANCELTHWPGDTTPPPGGPGQQPGAAARLFACGS